MRRAYKLKTGPFTLNSGYSAGSSVIDVPEGLPDPLRVVRGEMHFQGALIPAGVDALWMVKFDRAGHFCAATGFPASEICPVNDPLCDKELFRLVVLDLQPGRVRYAEKSFDPSWVELSRSRGDKIIVDINGTANPPLTVECVWAIEYLDDPVTPVVPGFGTWANASNGVGGRTVNAQKFGLRFTAPQSGVIASAKFNVVTLRSGATLQAKLCADASGSSGAQIGNASESLAVTTTGDKMLTFTGGPSVTNGTLYWMVFEAVSGTLDVDVDACNNAAGFSSGRGSEPLTNNLPNLDDWRIEIKVA